MYHVQLDLIEMYHEISDFRELKKVLVEQIVPFRWFFSLIHRIKFTGIAYNKWNDNNRKNFILSDAFERMHYGESHHKPDFH